MLSHDSFRQSLVPISDLFELAGKDIIVKMEFHFFKFLIQYEWRYCLNDLQISLNSVFLFWFQVDHIIERLNLEQKDSYPLKFSCILLWALRCKLLQQHTKNYIFITVYDDKVIYIENSGFYTWKKYKMKTIDTTRSNLGVPFDSTRQRHWH